MTPRGYSPVFLNISFGYHSFLRQVFIKSAPSSILYSSVDARFVQISGSGTRKKKLSCKIIHWSWVILLGGIYLFSREDLSK